MEGNVTETSWDYRFAQYLGRMWARLGYARHIEPKWIHHHELTIPLTQWPKALSGLRILHLSDLHAGKHLLPGYLERVLDDAKKIPVDLVVITGDFIHKGYRYVEWIAEKLRGLSAPLGVFGVLGNHDFSVRNALGIRRYPKLAGTLTQTLEQAGIQILRNRTQTLQFRNESFQLVGLDDLWSGECSPEQALQGVSGVSETPRIILAHNPLSWQKLGSIRCDLMLAGHTHGGQIRWFSGGRPFLRGQAKCYAAGLIAHPAFPIYVNTGIGHSFRFRFNVRPELPILNLVSELSPAISELPAISDSTSHVPEVSNISEASRISEANQ